jgi:hypothetical protein
MSTVAKWVGVLQPGYIPWVGFFEQLDQVDEFIYLDDVQFTRRDWRSRNRVLTRDGPKWLTVPVQSTVGDKSVVRALLPEVRIQNDRPWHETHLRTIEHAYKRAPYFDAYFSGLESILQTRHESLIELDIEIVALLCAYLGLEAPVRRSSSLEVVAKGSDRILELCLHVGATDCYSGAAARDYLELETFQSQRIRVWFQGHQCMPYRQQHASEFVSHLSVLDLLFNEGEGALEIIRAGRRLEAAE